MAVGDPVSLPAEWLTERALRKLRRSVERIANSREVPFDAYIPHDYVENGISEATLSEFRATALPFVAEAYEGECDDWSASYDVVARLDGSGDAHWHAAQLSPLDIERFGSRVETPEAGGLLYDVDVACSCSLELTARFMVRGATWTDIDLVRVALDTKEIEHRRRRHTLLEFDRLQALGLLPPNPE
jgi:hypothetical protein